MTGSTGAPPGWYGTEHGWRWWDGEVWGPLAPPPVSEEESGKRAVRRRPGSTYPISIRFVRN